MNWFLCLRGSVTSGETFLHSKTVWEGFQKTDFLFVQTACWIQILPKSGNVVRHLPQRNCISTDRLECALSSVDEHRPTLVHIVLSYTFQNTWVLPEVVKHNKPTMFQNLQNYIFVILSLKLVHDSRTASLEAHWFQQSPKHRPYSTHKRHAGAFQLWTAVQWTSCAFGSFSIARRHLSILNPVNQEMWKCLCKWCKNSKLRAWLFSLDICVPCDLWGKSLKHVGLGSHSNPCCGSISHWLPPVFPNGHNCNYHEWTLRRTSTLRGLEASGVNCLFDTDTARWWYNTLVRHTQHPMALSLDKLRSFSFRDIGKCYSLQGDITSWKAEVECEAVKPGEKPQFSSDHTSR